MSDEKKYTERELVEAQRWAFISGSDWRWRVQNHQSNITPIDRRVNPGGWTTALEETAGQELYPMPKVRRTRVLPVDNKLEVKYEDGKFWHRDTSIPWDQWTQSYGKHSMAVTPDRVRAWAELLARPTEEVDDA